MHCPRSLASHLLAFALSVGLDAPLRLGHNAMAFSIAAGGYCQQPQRSHRLCMSTTSDKKSETASGAATTEQQLQQRFEQAMQRRKQRRFQEKDPTGSDNTIGDTSNEGKYVNNAAVTEDDIRTNIEPKTFEAAENIHDGFTNEPTTTIENEAVKSTTKRKQKQQRKNETDDHVRDNVRRRPVRKNASTREIYERRKSFDHYNPTGRYNDQQYSFHDDAYDDYSGGEYHNDYDERYSSPSTPTCEWETYRSTPIVFPPLAQSKNDNEVPTRPKAIIHFVGGTLFGSYPRKFYGSLLEDISCKCDAVVVATPVPLVLPGKGLVNRLEKWMFDESGSDDDYENWNRGQGRRKRQNDRESGTNPLDHLCLAETIQREFNNAYRDVILDEYCSDNADDGEVEEFMKSVPIIGVGHSLGARIQAISCSHPRISKAYLSMGKGNRLIRSGRDGMIYLGFANWEASASIPGVETLDRTVKRRSQRKQKEDNRGFGRRDDVWDNRSRRRRYSRYDRYEAEDLDLADVFSDVVSGVANGAKQIGEALTPESDDLEFSPTPNELWDDLSSPDGRYSRSCRHNLIVQFNQDPIDQGSRMARTLLTAYSEELLNSTSSVDNDNKEGQQGEHLHNVKFARLPGGHLTPVTLQDGIAQILPRGAISLLSSSYDFIIQQLAADERAGKSSEKQRREAKDVADTVASYILSLGNDGRLS